MSTNKTHWPSLLILVTFGISAAFLFLFSAGLGINSIIDLLDSNGDPAGQMIVAIAYGFEFILLLSCSLHVFQRTMGRDQASRSFIFPYSKWQIIAVIGIVLASVVLGAAVVYTKIAWLEWLLLPILTILVIVPPIWLIFGIGSKGISLGPRWHIFSMLGISLTISPLIMIVFEFSGLVAVLVTGGVFIAIQEPVLFKDLISIGRILTQETNPELILNLIEPYVRNPYIVGMAIGYISVFVPLIEELFKPLAVWVFARKLLSPAQGFAMGMLSGGAFALIESLNASGDGSISWAVVVSVRTVTSLLHMTTSGLVGWGIASTYLDKRVSRFFSAYLTSVLIHGIWNACVAGISILSVGETFEKPDWLFEFIPALLSGMFVIGFGMFVVLIASNRKLQNLPNPALLQQTQAGTLPDEIEIQSTTSLTRK